MRSVWTFRHWHSAPCWGHPSEGWKLSSLLRRRQLLWWRSVLHWLWFVFWSSWILWWSIVIVCWSAEELDGHSCVANAVLPTLWACSAHDSFQLCSRNWFQRCLLLGWPQQFLLAQVPWPSRQTNSARTSHYTKSGVAGGSAAASSERQWIASARWSKAVFGWESEFSRCDRQFWCGWCSESVAHHAAPRIDWSWETGKSTSAGSNFVREFHCVWAPFISRTECLCCRAGYPNFRRRKGSPTALHLHLCFKTCCTWIWACCHHVTATALQVFHTADDRSSFGKAQQIHGWKCDSGDPILESLRRLQPDMSMRRSCSAAFSKQCQLREVGSTTLFARKVRYHLKWKRHKKVLVWMPAFEGNQ